MEKQYTMYEAEGMRYLVHAIFEDASTSDMIRHLTQFSWNQKMSDVEV